MGGASSVSVGGVPKMVEWRKSYVHTVSMHSHMVKGTQSPVTYVQQYLKIVERV